MNNDREHPPVPEKKNERRRKNLLWITFLILLAYFITQCAVLAAKALGLTSMEYSYIFIYSGIVIAFTTLFLIVIRFKRAITLRFIRITFYAQFSLYIVIYILWVYRLNEIRLFGLYCALIAIILEILYTGLAQSMLMSLGTVFVHACVTWYAIEVAGQTGDLAVEYFFLLGFVPTFVFLPLVARRFTLQRNEINESKRRIEETNTHLLAANQELQAEKDMTEVELELAARVQRSFFASRPPDVDGWDIAFAYRPRYGVSGDFFDFYTEGRTLKGASIFDVAGHGVSSALVTIIARPIFYRCFRDLSGDDPVSIMKQCEKLVFDELRNIEMFITGIIMRFDETGLAYANAGHPSFLIRRKGTGETGLSPEGAGEGRGSPLGMGDDLGHPPRVKRVALERDDVILLFTDGLVESFDRAKSPYGIERLSASLSRAPYGTADDMIGFIMREFDDFIHRGEGSVKDDITAIILKKT